jgi:pimeloyl-ACP methyl ester carboxylesterase
VVLSNSLGGTSADWARVMDGLSATTRICAYDRAGQGWSEEASSPRDGIQSATELHTLLERAGEHGPYVLAGHSTGGTYAMTYASRYPDEVAGMVLLDSSSPEQFTRMPAYPSQYQMLRRMYGPLSTLSRTGLGQLLPGVSPLTGEDAARVDALTSQPKSFRTQRDEVSVIPEVFRQAQALTTLGDRPLAVLTASDNAKRTEGWSAAQDVLAGLSSNSVHRTVTSTHVGMVGAARPAAAAVRAIGEVVTAARTHSHLPAR